MTTSPRLFPVWCLALSLLACDPTPKPIRELADKRLPALREHVATVQKACTKAGPNWKPSDWGPFASDPDVLNVKISCKPIDGLNMAVGFDPMRPAPPGDKSSRMFHVGRSKKREPFPPEIVNQPSWLTTEPAVDLCARSGHPDDRDFAEVCVAFKMAPKT
jgi:hypothetical protein